MNRAIFRVIGYTRRRRLVAALGLLVLAWLAILGYLLWSGYRDAIHAAEVKTRDQAALIESRLDGTLRRADGSLRALQQQIPRAALRRQAAPRDASTVDAQLKLLVRDFPGVVNVRVFDANGDLIYPTGEGLTGTNIADRAHFRAARDSREDSPVFSEVLVARTTGKSSVFVSRPMRDKQGVFCGVVAAVLDIAYFQALLDSLDLGAGGSVAILRSDNFTRVVRVPPLADLTNSQIAPDSPTRKALAGGKRTASAAFSAATDGVARIYSLHALQDHPFIVSVGIARDTALAGWRQRWLTAGLFVALLLALLSGVLARLWRTEDRLTASDALMRGTFEQAAVGIAHIEVGTYRMLLVNEAYCRLLGYTRGELTGSDSRRLTPAMDLPAREAERARVIAGEVAASAIERPMIRKDGSTVWVRRSLSLVRGADGSPAHFIAVIEDITARRQADEARARLAAIAESSNDAIFIRDTDENIVYWNPGAYRLYGYTAAEVIGRDSVFLVPQELLGESLHRRETLHRDGVPSNFETVRLRKDGTRVDVSIDVSFVRDVGGHMIGRAIIARDISARRQTEKIRTLLALLALLVRTANEAATPQAGFAACLAHICAYGDWRLGHLALYEAGRSAGVAPINFWHCAESARFAEFIRASNGYAHNEGTGQFVGVAMRTRKSVWVEDLSLAYRFGRMQTATDAGVRAGFAFPVVVGNEVAGFFEFFATDARAPDTMFLEAIDSVASQLARMIERSRAGAKLAYLAAIVENASFAIFSRALDGTILTWNAGAEKMLGYSAAEAVGRAAGFTLAPGYTPNLQENNRRLLDGAAIARESDRLTRDGRQINVLINHGLICDSAGAILGVAVLMQDITALKAAQTAVVRMNAELETRVASRTAELAAANEELNSFSYTVAHDLRTPVRAIKGFTTMVLTANEGKLDETSVRNLKRVLAGGVRMGELIDDLLDLARLSRQAMSRRRVNLSELATAIVAVLREAQPQRNVTVQVQPDMVIDGDPGLMRAVMDNLIGNAWKFTAKLDAARIEVGAAPRGGETEYFVRDNGVGFDMAYAHKLFAPFQRLHLADEFEGTGIGLATVNKVILRHGGACRVESAVGQGTTVFFTLGPR